MFHQKTLRDFHSVTFSQALAAGRTHSGWLVAECMNPDLLTRKSGRVAALASHSVSLASAKAQMTRDTFGLLFGGLSPSAGLQSSLVSRLHRQMDDSGSPEYVLTWRRWDMASGEPICALRASGRHTSGSGCFGWPTAAARDWRSEQASQEYENARMNQTRGKPLSQVSRMAVGWPTIQATEARQGYQDRSNPHKRGSQESLSTVAVNSLIGPIPSGGPAATGSGDECRPSAYLTPKLPSGGSCERTSRGGGLRKLEDQTEMLHLRLPNMAGWKLNPVLRVATKTPFRSRRGKGATEPQPC
jgi:hypothetical protein